jgi:hypothetical protein
MNAKCPPPPVNTGKGNTTVVGYTLDYLLLATDIGDNMTIFKTVPLEVTSALINTLRAGNAKGFAGNSELERYKDKLEHEEYKKRWAAQITCKF